MRELFKTLDPEFEPFDPVVELWLTVGFLLWTEKLDEAGARNTVAEFFQKLFDEEPLTCPACSKRLEFDMPNMTLFWEQGEVTCRGCSTQIRVLNPADLVGEDLAEEAPESQSEGIAR